MYSAFCAVIFGPLRLTKLIHNFFELFLLILRVFDGYGRRNSSTQRKRGTSTRVLQNPLRTVSVDDRTSSPLRWDFALFRPVGAFRGPLKLVEN